MYKMITSLTLNFLFLIVFILGFNTVNAVENKDNKEINSYCDKIQNEFNRYDWGDVTCKNLNWEYYRKSNKGDPLMFLSFGELEKIENKNLTILMCGVHGDEITPVRFCFEAIKYFLGEGKDKLIGKGLIIAPIVSPDSFFIKRPTRTNARGVDVNRNFPTEDFKALALKLWISKFKRDKRRFPGKNAMSEPEVVFQVNLIKRFNPGKIISVHSPLTMLDYDGPGSETDGAIVNSEEPSTDLLIRMSQKAKDYKIQNYPYFPGSLGNWAGKERKIPTYTLELPSSNPAKAKEYWDLFADAVADAVTDDLSNKKMKSEILNNENSKQVQATSGPSESSSR